MKDAVKFESIYKKSGLLVSMTTTDWRDEVMLLACGLPILEPDADVLLKQLFGIMSVNQKKVANR